MVTLIVGIGIVGAKLLQFLLTMCCYGQLLNVICCLAHCRVSLAVIFSMILFHKLHRMGKFCINSCYKINCFLADEHL